MGETGKMPVGILLQVFLKIARILAVLDRFPEHRFGLIVIRLALARRGAAALRRPLAWVGRCVALAGRMRLRRLPRDFLVALIDIGLDAGIVRADAVGRLLLAGDVIIPLQTGDQARIGLLPGLRRGAILQRLGDRVADRIAHGAAEGVAEAAEEILHVGR